MLLSLKWLSKYVDISQYTTEQLAHIITLAGLEVEEIKYLAKGSNLVVGQIIDLKPHPNADTLHLLKVNIGNEVLEIVCGADNVVLNGKVIVAKVGAYLDAIDLTIKKSIIRGQTSNGMCCSLSELGVDKKTLSKEQLNGIEILSDDAVVGDINPLEFLGLDDVIFDIGLTPNRGDCMSMWGLALDIGAIIGKKARLEEVKEVKGSKSNLKVEIKTNACPVFKVRKIQGIQIKPSVTWMKNILIANNIKPINNIVDLSNYIMLLTGQPLHMYDADKVKDNTFVIRDDFEGKVLMLDEKEYEIKKKDIVICCDGKVACLAGILGSHFTMIDENTKNIIIEAASFDASIIRRTVKRLNLASEASSRFIKETDKYNTSLVLDYTALLLKEISKVDQVEEIVEKSILNLVKSSISLPYQDVEKRLGFKIAKKDIETIFTNLDFKFKLEDNVYLVQVPTRRNDLSIKEDLIEEIIRIYGFEKLPSTLPFDNVNIGSYSESQQKIKIIKEFLINNGLNETLTYSLTSKQDIANFDYILKNDVINISNPLTEDRKYLRKSLIPSLLQTIAYNKSKNNKDVALFEVSNVYASEIEVKLLSLAIGGAFKSTLHLNDEVVDYYSLKGMLEGLLGLLGVDLSRLSIEKNKDMQQMHPYRSGRVFVDKKEIGYLGEVHPILLDKNGIDKTYILELNLDKLLNLKGSKIKFKKLNIFPSTSRDISMIVKKDIEADKIIRLILRQEKELIKDVEIFDVYEGEHVSQGYKSIAVSIIYQSDDKTLLDEEVNLLNNKVIEELIKKFKVEIRK